MIAALSFLGPLMLELSSEHYNHLHSPLRARVSRHRLTSVLTDFGLWPKIMSSACSTLKHTRLSGDKLSGIGSRTTECMQATQLSNAGTERGFHESFSFNLGSTSPIWSIKTHIAKTDTLHLSRCNELRLSIIREIYGGRTTLTAVSSALASAQGTAVSRDVFGYMSTVSGVTLCSVSILLCI